MSRRTRKGVLLPITALAVLAGAVASFAQTITPVDSSPPPGPADTPLVPAAAPPAVVIPDSPPGAPILLTPPDGALPSWLTLPATNDPAAHDPAASIESVSGLPAHQPAPGELAPGERAPGERARGGAAPDPAIPPAHLVDRHSVPAVAPGKPQPAGADRPSPSVTAPAVPTLTFGAVADPTLQVMLEQWQSDHLLYSFALRAIQTKEQLCALAQAPDTLCRRRGVATVTVEREPVEPASRSMVEPVPTPERVPPFRVVSVAGTGADIVVTLRNTDLQETRAVRPGGWIDQDFTLVSADYRTAVIKNRKRSYRLPVTAGSTWGGGS